MVVKDGRIVAQGAHEVSMRESEYYAALVGASTNGLLTQAA